MTMIPANDLKVILHLTIHPQDRVDFLLLRPTMIIADYPGMRILLYYGNRMYNY